MATWTFLPPRNAPRRALPGLLLAAAAPARAVKGKAVEDESTDCGFSSCGKPNHKPGIIFDWAYHDICVLSDLLVSKDKA